MQSQAATVEEYLAELPQDRRLALSAIREVILNNLDKDIEEGMQYGMIGYYVPHRVYPAGYHCDPQQPLCYAGLASQKNHISLYMMGVYCDTSEHKRWFVEAWKKTGKKLDMGKCCIRFKNLEGVPLEVVGQAIKRMPAKKFIAIYEEAKETVFKRESKPRAKAKARPKARPVKARAKRATAKS